MMLTVADGSGVADFDGLADAADEDVDALAWVDDADLVSGGAAAWFLLLHAVSAAARSSSTAIPDDNREVHRMLRHRQRTTRAPSDPVFVQAALRRCVSIGAMVFHPVG